MADDVGVAIGRRLVESRGTETQVDFAESIGVVQPTLSYYERGLVPQSWLTLRRMVETGIDANWLLTGKKGNHR